MYGNPSLLGVVLAKLNLVSNRVGERTENMTQDAGTEAMEEKTGIDGQPADVSEDSGQASENIETVKKRSATERWRRRAFMSWGIIGAVIIFLGVLQLAGVLWQAVAVAAISIFLAFLFHEPVDMLSKKGIPRVLGSGICLVFLLVIFVGIVLAFVPALTSESAKLFTNLPQYADKLGRGVGDIMSYGVWGIPAEQTRAAFDAAAKWMTEQGASMVSGMAGGILGGVIDFGTWVMLFVIAIICAFWIMADWPVIAREIRILTPEKRLADFDLITGAFKTAVYGWIKATVICAVIVGLATWAFLVFFQIPYAGILALACGILYFIPYIGPAVSAVLCGLVGLLVSPTIAILAIIVQTVVVNVVANFISPRIMRTSVNLHPALVMLAILIGGGLAGVWGMLLSIPLAASAQGVFIAYFEAKTGKVLARPEGALFRAPSEKSSQ